jgi:hypothetical protein
MLAVVVHPRGAVGGVERRPSRPERGLDRAPRLEHLAAEEALDPRALGARMVRTQHLRRRRLPEAPVRLAPEDAERGERLHQALDRVGVRPARRGELAGARGAVADRVGEPQARGEPYGARQPEAAERPQREVRLVHRASGQCTRGFHMANIPAGLWR